MHILIWLVRDYKKRGYFKINLTITLILFLFKILIKNAKLNTNSLCFIKIKKAFFHF